MEEKSLISILYSKKMYYDDFREGDVSFIYTVDFDKKLIEFGRNGGHLLMKHKFKDILKLDISNLNDNFDDGKDDIYNQD